MSGITGWLDAAEGRVEAATVGAWEAYSRHDAVPGSRNYLGVGRVNTEVAIFEDRYVRTEDAEFIAAARTDLPAAIAALRGVIGLIGTSEALALGTPTAGEFIEVIADELGVKP